MDGSGALFEPFLRALPPHIRTVTLSYPSQTPLSYAQLAKYVRTSLPKDEPYILLAESFSGPVALLLAAEGDWNLRVIIFVASFASTPLGVWGRLIAPLPWETLFRIQPPMRVLRWLLMEPSTSQETALAVRKAIGCVRPSVLAYRMKEALTADHTRLALGCRIRLIYFQAGRDRLIEKRIPARLCEVSSQVEVVTIPGPHLLLQCAPQACVSAMNNLGLLEQFHED